MRTVSKVALRESELVIHVFDETRQMSKDFKCTRSLLLNNMKYFDVYLKDTDKAEEIDI